MKQHAFSRTELLLGPDAMEKLYKSTVAVFGIGGVGSYVVEALARSGIGKLILVDADDVCITNINRQIHATVKTIGLPKVQVMAQRIVDINPRAEVVTFKEFYLPDNAEKMISKDYDYVVDAIDTVTSKIDLVVRCKTLGIPIISAMGAGNKLDPTKLKVADIYETKICPLAKVMRYELRKRNIASLKVVYSEEIPVKPRLHEVATCKKQIPGSVSFVPPVMGFIIAGEVIKDLINKDKQGDVDN